MSTTNRPRSSVCCPGCGSSLRIPDSAPMVRCGACGLVFEVPVAGVEPFGDLVGRGHRPDAPDRVWCTDIKQTRTGEAFVDRAVGCQFLDHARAAGAAQFRSYRANHLEARRHIFQNFGNVFAQRPQLAAAIGAVLFFGHKSRGLARQLGGKRTARGLL